MLAGPGTVLFNSAWMACTGEIRAGPAQKESVNGGEFISTARTSPRQLVLDNLRQSWGIIL